MPLEDVTITEEEVKRIKSTIGSLYQVTKDTTILPEGDKNPFIANVLKGQTSFVGDLVVLLSYPEQCIWLDKKECLYARDVIVKVLSTTGFVGMMDYGYLKEIKQTI